MYILTDEDLHIFRESRTNGSAFTRFYFNGWEFMAWQLAVHHASQSDITVVGGFASTDIDTLVYEADERRYVTMRWLIEHHHNPTVLAWTGESWRKVRASVPYYESTGTILRVKTSGGKVIDVSPSHRFLTSRGYVCTADLALGDRLVAPYRLPATVDNDVVNARSDSGISQDSPDRYSGHHYQYGEQPLLVSDAGLSFSPSLGGARKPIHLPFSGPNIPLGQEQSYICRWVAWSGRHLPSKHSILPGVLHALPGLPLRDRVANDVLARPEQATQVLRQSWDTTSQYWQDVLGEDRIYPEVTASSCVEPGLVEWKYPSASWPEIGQNDSGPGSWQPRSVCHIDLVSPASPSLSTLTSLFHVDSPSVPPCGNSTGWNYTILETVISIEYVGVRDLFDLHVPIFNNYVAEGVVHHNSGKTVGIAMSGATYAATSPGFKFYDTSVTHEQAYAMFQSLTDRLGEGVPFYDRFIGPNLRIGAKMIEKPHPKIVLVYGIRTKDGVRKCRAELNFLSAERNAQRIKNLEGDYVIVDQAELVPDLATTVRNLGTRARGRRPDGSERLGRIVLLANSEDSPELWSYYDRAELDPVNYLSLTISTYDNTYLTQEDWRRLKSRVSLTGDVNEIAQHLTGERPVGAGKFFPPTVIERCTDLGLDNLMEVALLNKYRGFQMEQGEHAGIVLWQMPYDQGRLYLQMGDPGSGNPPERGAPTIGIWDITAFPKEPARLRAFWWGYGRGMIGPFMSQFNLWMGLYHTQFRAGWDDTGMQKFLSELNYQVESKLVLGLDFTNLKPFMLNAARLLCEKGLFQWPRNIRGIRWQLARYAQPDEKIPQDIVAMIMMTAFWLVENFAFELGAAEALAQQSRIDTGDMGNAADRYGRMLDTRGVMDRPGRN